MGGYQKKNPIVASHAGNVKSPIRGQIKKNEASLHGGFSIARQLSFLGFACSRTLEKVPNISPKWFIEIW